MRRAWTLHPISVSLPIAPSCCATFHARRAQIRFSPRWNMARLPMRPSSRRNILKRLALTASAVSLPASVWAALVKTQRLTEGPFYPTSLPLDDDNDLTRVKGQSGVAAGIFLDLSGRVVDVEARPVRNAVVEIWQCDSFGRYHHPDDTNNAPLEPISRVSERPSPTAKGAIASAPSNRYPILAAPRTFTSRSRAANSPS
jgi:Dioxygenase